MLFSITSHAESEAVSFEETSSFFYLPEIIKELWPEKSEAQVKSAIRTTLKKTTFPRSRDAFIRCMLYELEK